VDLLPPGFPLWAIAGIGFATFVGSLFFSIIRAHPSLVVRLGMIIASTGAGLALTPGICLSYGIEPISQCMVVGFVVGLLVMPICRAVVAFAEEEGRQWLRSVLTSFLDRLGRVFGPHKTPGPEAERDISDISDIEEGKHDHR